MGYVESDLVRIAKRENNTKRGYLVVDPLQGKHIPVSPSKALKLFSDLADVFRKSYQNERLLLIGFAETATAIGAQVAISIGAKYIQTTREMIPDVEYLFFSEEHSHATEQKLIKDDIDSIMDDTDRIIFIEDEVTTGKTILNIISILEKKYPSKMKYSVASILNGMSEEHLNLYEKKGIMLHYLVKTNHSTYDEHANQFKGDGHYYEMYEKNTINYSLLKVNGAINPRRLVNSKDYWKACQKLWNEIHNVIGHISEQSILVIGTEETMFPALFIGTELEKLGNKVLSHSTTRSPIAVSLENEYPLHTRYQLKSLYDAQRKTFIYDIGKYDNVLIVTDAPESETEGLETLINAVAVKNNTITLIRWC
ncbi:MAG: hypothetical protein GX299_05185 [Epulopiscium sp.]|nr:hypothetical protein [Candidatus Epulonipiscium sp.]